MTVYMFAVSASNSPIKMRTMEAFTEIEALGKRLIRLFYEKPKRRRYYQTQETPERLEDFIVDRYHYRVYFFEANSGQTGKLISGKKIWEAMRREEGLKKEMTKAMLR
jgi:hypothetical protein